MKKKIMITGADGFLGGRIAAYYEGRYETIRVGHKDLDITDERSVAEYFHEKAPDAVFHCAAVSNTRTCEENPGLSEAVNRNGAVNMAKGCKENGSRLVFMSSDQIYAGSSLERANKESDEIPPANVYGTHKKQAEDEILQVLPDGICLRLSWMYDFPVRGLKSSSNLLTNLIKSMVQNRPMKLPVHDRRGITWAQDVIRNLEPVMDLPGGIYNFGSESTLSSFETGKRVFQMLNRNGNRESLVIPDETGFNDSARNLAMDAGKLKSCGITFPETAEGFQKCLVSNPEYVQAFIGEAIVEF